MKHLFSVLLLALLISSTSFAQIDPGFFIGIKGGVTGASIIYDQKESDNTLGVVTDGNVVVGGSYGLMGGFIVNKYFMVASELMFQQTGAVYNRKQGSINLNEETVVRNRYAMVPILPTLTLGGNAYFKFGVGPWFGIKINENITGNTNFNDYATKTSDFGGAADIGFGIRGGRHNFNLGLMAIAGGTNIIKDPGNGEAGRNVMANLYAAYFIKF